LPTKFFQSIRQRRVDVKHHRSRPSKGRAFRACDM
jgi:hypothetical protein